MAKIDIGAELRNTLESMQVPEKLLDDCMDCFDGYCLEHDTEVVDPLGVTRKVVYEIDLTTGGPAEWLKVEVGQRTGEIKEIRWYFAWGTTRGDRLLQGDEFNIVEQWIRRMVYIEEF